MEGASYQELLVSDSNGCGSGDTVGLKLGDGKGLREGWDSKELWKSVGWRPKIVEEKSKAHLSRGAKDGPPKFGLTR
jgi:hypothetical protein